MAAGVCINDLQLCNELTKHKTEDKLTLANPNMYALNTAEYLSTQHVNTQIVQTHIHTYTGYTGTHTQVHRYTGTHVHRYTGTQVHMYTGYTGTHTQVHRYTGTQVHRYTGTQVHRYTSTGYNSLNKPSVDSRIAPQ